MRSTTRKKYEDEIASLKDQLKESMNSGLSQKEEADRYRYYYTRLVCSRTAGEDGRKWAIEQALLSHQPDVVTTARQIADFVFGPDYDHNREAEIR